MSSKRSLGKVFVTGADGFIGSHLVEFLLQRGFEVTAMCLYNSMGRFGWLDSLASSAPSNLKLILGDVRDAGFMESAIKSHNTVFHLASLIAIPYSYVAPQSYFDTNVNGALNVANACIKAGVSRLIHTSTSEVYGTAQTVPINETHPLVGQSPYSASKIAADMLIESFVRSFELAATTLRPFNTFGPRQSMRAVIPTVIAQMLSGASEIELGSTSPTRDFNYVGNTIDAFYALAECGDDAVIGKTYNAGSGREISVADLVNLLAKTCGTSVRIKSSQDRMRPAQSEVERLLCDSTLLTKISGWKPSTSLEQGLAMTIEWQKLQTLGAVAKRYHV